MVVRFIAVLLALSIASAAFADSSTPEAERAAAPSELLPRIARRLEELRARPHLRQFRAVQRLKADRIEYQNGVTQVPNPDYDRLTREAARDPRPVMRGMIPRMVPRYASHDGLALSIRLERSADLARQQAFVSPYARLGAWELIVSIDGAEGKPLLALRAEISRILDEEVVRAGGKVAPRAF